MTNPSTLRLLVSRDGTVCRVQTLSRDETVLGRGAECDVVLEDSLVSRRHCRVVRQHGRVWIEDLQSANGTFLRGKPVSRAPLEPGDTAEVGPFAIEVRSAAEPPELQTQRGAPPPPAGGAGQELALLVSILGSTNATVSRAALVERLLSALATALQAQRAFLFRWDSKHSTVKRELAHHSAGADRELPVSETLVRKVAADREPYLANDIQQHGDGALPSIARLAEGQVQSVVVAPLERGRKLTGILYLDSPAARRSFTTADLDLLTAATTCLAGLFETVEAREELAQENKKLRALVAPGREVPIDTLVAPGSPMNEVIESLTRAAARDVSILITGETGTGKEVAARAIHRGSPRAAGRFIAINCGAIPENLIESELFGHAKGAFTGATEDRAGLIEMADRGTLFLDEVGELPLTAQVRLLRVLEERQVVRVGSSTPVAVNFRLVAATHRDLPERVKDGSFREDLYYRLNVFPIELPPLRERLMDLPAIVGYMIATLAPRVAVPVTGPAPDLIPMLARHPWPGNLRELRNVLERALILEDSPLLTARSLPVQILATAPAAPPPAASAAAFREAGTQALRPFADVLRDVERAYLQQLMAQVGDNVAAMSRVSGFTRLTIYRKLGALGLAVPGKDDAED